MVVVIEHLHGMVAIDIDRFLARGIRVGAVHDGSAERSDVDIAIACIQDDTTTHGVENILGKSLGVVFRKNDVMSGVVSLVLSIAWVRSIGEYTTTPSGAVHHFAVHLERPVKDRDL